MTPRILIVDDHEIVRMGLNAHITKSRPDWKILGEAVDGEQAMKLALELRPDIIIMDISMPRMSGLQASARLREVGSAIPVLMFTTHDFERLTIEVREAGAQGYVLKSETVRHLIHAIDVLLAGGTFFGGPEPENSGGKEPNPGLIFFQGFAIAT